jgi:hypothetical protein
MNGSEMETWYSYNVKGRYYNVLSSFKRNLVLRFKFKREINVLSVATVVTQLTRQADALA